MFFPFSNPFNSPKLIINFLYKENTTPQSEVEILYFHYGIKFFHTHRIRPQPSVARRSRQ